MCPPEVPVSSMPTTLWRSSLLIFAIFTVFQKEFSIDKALPHSCTCQPCRPSCTCKMCKTTVNKCKSTIVGRLVIKSILISAYWTRKITCKVSFQCDMYILNYVNLKSVRLELSVSVLVSLHIVFILQKILNWFGFLWFGFNITFLTSKA